MVTQNLLKLILACEDAYSKLSKVVTIADVDSVKCVEEGFVQIWKLKFDHKIKFLYRLWAQGLLKLKLSWDFEAEVQLVFCSWSLVEVMKIILGRESEARFGQDFEVKVESKC